VEIALSGFYEILSPRCTVLISTVDKKGNANAAPFSFVTPVSVNPPLLLFAAAPARHTLANARETGDFVFNVVPEGLLDKLLVCSKAFPENISEIAEAGLTERKSKQVQAPSIEECIGWIECKYEFEQEAGDHILVIGRVVHAECKDEFTARERFDVAKARPVMHVKGRRFVVAETVVEAEAD